MTKAKILVTGLNGFLGTRFKELYCDKFHITGFEHQGKKSITERKYTFDLIKSSTADIILHLAAKTHIDRCEKDRIFGKKSPSWRINVAGTKNIADACAENQKLLIYISTECVFDGKKSWYQETDEPHPINWYGETKLQGEKEINRSGAKFLILRSTLAFGHPVIHPFDLFHFFLNKIKNNDKIMAVDNQLLSLTFVDDLVNALTVLIQNKAQGIYHYAGGKRISPYKFALQIGKFLDKPVKITPVSLKDFFGPSASLRLTNAVLSSAKIKKEFDLAPSNIHQALKKLLIKA